MKSRFKKIFTSITLLVSVLTSSAKEGMWIPMLVGQLNHQDMTSMGFKLSAEEIYSVNQSSLKDAIVHFGGGCTGELISAKGLMITNHHCGYGEIQSHSTVENDYLKDGFWAMRPEDELPNPGLTATFIVRMEDVTDSVYNHISTQTTEVEKQELIKKNIQKIGERAVKETHYDYIIKPFYYGNKYYLFVTETFKDVRLVGAPPSSIGKFGFDTDNWVWPRHTGDFSVFRIYADKNNKPAEYSKENVPYKPKHFFPISLKEVKENDFTLLYGFPGRTQQYLTSHAVDYVLNRSNPAKISMRDKSLEIINTAMQRDAETKIKYAAKQSSISNAHKKWIGESKGLKRLNAIVTKQEFEQQFTERINQNPQYKNQYGHLLQSFDTTYKRYNDYLFAREMFIELFYYGPEIIQFASEFTSLVDELLAEEPNSDKINGLANSLKPKIAMHFKDYDAQVDKQLFAALTKLYYQNMPQNLKPAYHNLVQSKYKGNYDAFADMVYNKSIFVNRVNLSDFVFNPTKGKAKKIKKDAGFQITQQLLNQYQIDIKPAYTQLSNKIDNLYQNYMQALLEVMPDKKVYYPDANSTLRVAYGKVEGYEPKDGAYYNHYTTVNGILEKYIPGDREYDVPQKLIELINNKDFGQYAYGNVMPVCFIASNHSTGGNSGSPVLDANGNLKGLNFDRCWEGTMSDIMFDPDRCRNIMVDMNYVLFIIDKFAGASHLIKELTLVK